MSDSSLSRQAGSIALIAGTALAVVDNASLHKSSFSGVTGLTGREVLIKYTYQGDADLSGAVTLDDFTMFLAGHQGTSPLGACWMTGDFDYNGSVTLDDFTMFLSGYQQQTAAL
jgi:hypothetical protein